MRSVSQGGEKRSAAVGTRRLYVTGRVGVQHQSFYCLLHSHLHSISVGELLLLLPAMQTQGCIYHNVTLELSSNILYSVLQPLEFCSVYNIRGVSVWFSPNRI